MTKELIRLFPRRGGIFEIEPDASSGSYFWAVTHLAPRRKLTPAAAILSGGRERAPTEIEEFSAVSVAHWPVSGWQVDQNFVNFLAPPNEISRLADLGDSIMTAIILAPFSGRALHFTDLGRLRVQESERVVALRTELTRCGAEVLEQGDTLTVFPSSQKLHGAEIETYNDHRMAMCFAILGLKVPGIKIKNPACVKKTFPNFFQKLATAPPHGLGAIILEASTGRSLAVEELFAE